MFVHDSKIKQIAKSLVNHFLVNEYEQCLKVNFEEEKKTFKSDAAKRIVDCFLTIMDLKTSLARN